MAMSNELFQQFLQTTDMIERTKNVASSISGWKHTKPTLMHLDDVSIGEALRSELQVVTNLFSSLVSYGKLTLMLTDVYRIVDESLAEALKDANIKMVTGSYLRKNKLVAEDFLVPIQDEWQFIVIGDKWFFGVDNRFNNFYTIKKKQAINKAREESRQGVES